MVPKAVCANVSRVLSHSWPGLRKLYLPAQVDTR